MNHWQIVMLLAVYAFSCLVDAEDDQQCVNDIVAWCQRQVFSTDATYTWKNLESVNGKTVDLYCLINGGSTGIVCYKNNYQLFPWYACKQDHISRYDGRPLSKDSLSGTDPEICYAASKITRLPSAARDRQKCVNDIVDWCDKQDYTNTVFFEWSTTETVDGGTAEIKCISAAQGISCQRTGEMAVWFVCTNTHSVSFKSKPLVKNGNDYADADICLGQSIIRMIPTTTASNDEQLGARDEMCVNVLVDWCKKKNYTNAGISVWTFSETVNGQTVSIKCKSDDKLGTKCTKSGYVGVWFSCSSNHLTTYKGVTLVENSQIGEDDEICFAASKISALIVYTTTGTNTLTAKEENHISGFSGIGTFIKNALKP